jgi:hypothetical protein
MSFRSLYVAARQSSGRDPEETERTIPLHFASALDHRYFHGLLFQREMQNAI